MRISKRSVLHALWIATALRVLIPPRADPDLWGHLLFGSLLLERGVQVTTGVAYSAYTAPAHPWINHELLAEATMADVYSDPVSVIFIRRVPSQAATLARFHAGRLYYDTSPLEVAFPALPPGTDAVVVPAAPGKVAAGAPAEDRVAAAGAPPAEHRAAAVSPPRRFPSSATLAALWIGP